MSIVYIGLGTNLGNKEDNIDQAKKYIAEQEIVILCESSLEITKPVDYLEQPDFLNQVIKVETKFDKNSLLNTLKAIELKMGRQKIIDKGPRIIDLDILLYERDISNEKNLVLPHHGITDRLFVLKHLLEISPELTDPLSGKPYQEFYDERKNELNS